jgi:hypothetical protein
MTVRIGVPVRHRIDGTGPRRKILTWGTQLP